MAAATARLTRRRAVRQIRRTATAYLFLAPALVLIAVFTLLPFAEGILLSFQSWDGVARSAPFVGLSNYARVIGDEVFWASLVNAAIFGLIGFVIGNVLALLMAVGVNSKARGATFFRIVFYQPNVLSVVVVALLFDWLLEPKIGILNRALSLIGATALQHNWLSDPTTALPAVSTAYVWHYWGFAFLLFLAGLQGVPHELYEAAAIDGAGSWQRFWHITWPQLTPVTTIVSILTLLAALQIFATVQLMTDGGPGWHTEVPTLHIYKEGFEFHRFGTAAAMSIVFGAILMVLSLFQIWVSRRFGAEIH